MKKSSKKLIVALLCAAAAVLIGLVAYDGIKASFGVRALVKHWIISRLPHRMHRAKRNHGKGYTGERIRNGTGMQKARRCS